ncbi:MAG: hypothetical protein ACR2GR_05910 [Rhodothermales bacterium]
MLHFAKETVAFAYQTSGLGAQTSKLETVLLRLDEIQEVELKNRMWGSKIVLHPKQLAPLERMPGAQGSVIAFSVKPKHQAEAEALVAQMQQAYSASPPTDLRSIPFRLPEADHGLTEITGLLYLDDEFLTFDVQTGLPGGSQKELQVIKVELAALAALRLDRGTLGDRLCIRPKTSDLLDAMPGTHQEELKLKLRKRHRADAEQPVYEVRRLQRMPGRT